MADEQDVVREVRDQLDALNVKFSDEEISARINTALEGIVNKDEFVRKIRFGGEGDPRLTGSKFARMGLSVGDIECLHGLMLSSQRLGFKGPSQELTNAFNALSKGEYRTAVAAKAADLRHLEDAFATGRLTPAAFKTAIEAVEWNYRAMDTAESGYGSQLIGAQYVGELWAGARLQSRVFSQIPSFPMTAPTAYLPVEAALPEMLFVAESTAYNSSNYTTSKSGSMRVQVDAKKFVIHQMWSDELDEDSIIPFLPFIRGQAQTAVAHYSDSLVLNGDTTNAGTGNINLDDADPADTKHYLAFDGIRHVGLVDVTTNQIDASGAVTLDDLSDIRGKLIDSTYTFDWGHPSDANDLLYVGDPESCDAISKLGEVLTVDKFGPQATVLTGQVARILGHPLISSMAVSKTEADGKVSTTASGNTKGQIVVFNRRGFNVGLRRDLTAEFERIPATGQFRLVHSLRMGLGRYTPTTAASGIEAAAVIFNITL